MSKQTIIMFILVAAIFFILLLLVYGARRTEGPLEVGEREISEEGGESSPPRVSVVAENLEVPWAIAFLPSGAMLATERPGRLVRIGENGAAHTIEGVAPTSEGGLLGLALHPDFEENGLVYLYLTTRTGGGLENRVERYVLDGDGL